MPRLLDQHYLSTTVDLALPPSCSRRLRAGIPKNRVKLRFSPRLTFVCCFPGVSDRLALQMRPLAQAVASLSCWGARLLAYRPPAAPPARGPDQSSSATEGSAGIRGDHKTTMPKQRRINLSFSSAWRRTTLEAPTVDFEIPESSSRIIVLADYLSTCTGPCKVDLPNACSIYLRPLATKDCFGIFAGSTSRKP